MRVAILLVTCSLGMGHLFAQSQLPAGYRPYHLQHVSAEEAAAKLDSVLPPNAQIVVDRKLNRVMVAGDQETNRLTTEFINSYDQPPRQPIRVAERQLRSTVRSYDVGGGQVDRVAAQLRSKYSNQRDVRFATDPRTGQLIVIAPLSIHQEIARQFPAREVNRTPEPQRPSPAVAPLRAIEPPQSLRYQLREVSWRDFEDDLQRIWSRRLSLSTQRNGEIATFTFTSEQTGGASIEVDRRTNLVTIQAPRNFARQLENVIQTIDRPRAEGQPSARVVSAGRADPAKVQKAVWLLENLKEQNNAAAQVAPRLADRKIPRQGGGQIVAKIFQEKIPEKKGAPPKPDDAEDDGGLIGPVRIEFLEELDVIIIRGNPRDVERVTKIINQIQSFAGATQPEVQIYQLQHINGEAVAELVSQLYSQVYEPRQGSISITPLGKPNALLLVGRPESLKSVIGLIEKLDTPVAPRTQLEVFQLRYMSALDAERRIEEFFASEAAATAQGQPGVTGTTTPRTGLSTRVRITSDYRSNSLIVQASPRDMQEVALLIAKIDVIQSNASNEVLVFKLKNALAEDLAPVLQDALNGQLYGAGIGRTASGLGGAAQQAIGQAGTTQQQIASVRSAMLSLMTVDTESGKVLKSGIMFDVRVTADTNSNSLVVTGPAENMELIGVLVEQLDQLPSANAQIKVFTVINGDATTLLEMLQLLFGQQTGQTNQGGAFGQLPVTGASGGESSLVPLRFAMDTRTNSIIVSGSEGDLLVIEALLARLDLDDIQSRNTTVFRLRNAPALDVADAINEFLDGRQTINNIDPTVISPFEQTERAVIVVPEVVSNSLIVNATDEYYEEIKRIILELDRRPPMVMIQVMIAEITLNDTEEFGVELGIQDSMVFTRGLTTGIAGEPAVGFPFNQQNIGNSGDAASLATREFLAGQGINNLGLGRINADLGYGGLVLSAGSESLNVLVRALHDKGKLQILSRPQIMTMDNLPAFIQVGSRVPRITSVQQVNNGTINNTVLENVGILLGVTPRTSPDGLIVMEIDAEKSSLGAEADGIPISISATGDVIRSPQINITTAQTTISARSGQTVVFAGLITKENMSFMHGVPVLSDIPILGRAFRYDGWADRRTELMIILTPYIVDGDDDIDWLNTTEADRMHWCFGDVLDVHGEAALSLKGGGHVTGPQPQVVYPHLDPTASEPQPQPVEELPPARQSGEPRSDLPPPVRTAPDQSNTNRVNENTARFVPIRRTYNTESSPQEWISRLPAPQIQ